MRERGRRTGLLPSMVIAAVPATDLQHGWADEADEVADGRQRRPQHAAPRPRRDMPRRSGELQARPAGLSGVPRGGEERGQRGGLASWGQRSYRSPVFQASQREGDESLPGALPRLGGCLSWVTSQSRSQPGRAWGLVHARVAEHVVTLSLAVGVMVLGAGLGLIVEYWDWLTEGQAGSTAVRNVGLLIGAARGRRSRGRGRSGLDPGAPHLDEAAEKTGIDAAVSP